MTRQHFWRTRLEAIATSVGAGEPIDPAGASDRYKFFASKRRLTMVVSNVGMGDSDLALAHGMAGVHADPNLDVLRIVLPKGHANSTRQRSAWLKPDRQPEVFVYNQAGDVFSKRIPTRDESIAKVTSGPANGDPRAEFNRSVSRYDLGKHAILAQPLLAIAGELGLTPAHRQSGLAWHHLGMRVLSIQRSKAGLRVRAGIHVGTGANKDKVADGESISLEVTGPDPIGGEIVDRIEVAVRAGIATRSPGGAFHAPDEHLLQALLAERPEDIGLERTTREVPAWRPAAPKDPKKRKAWARGYIDLAGYSPKTGKNVVVETKLSKNDDPQLLFQGLDYYIWSLAYADALQERRVFRGDVETEVLYVLASDPDHGESLHASHLLAVQVDAFVPEFPWRFVAVSNWFGGGPVQVGQFKL